MNHLVFQMFFNRQSKINNRKSYRCPKSRCLFRGRYRSLLCQSFAGIPLHAIDKTLFRGGFHLEDTCTGNRLESVESGRLLHFHKDILVILRPRAIAAGLRCTQEAEVQNGIAFLKRVHETRQSYLAVVQIFYILRRGRVVLLIVFPCHETLEGQGEFFPGIHNHGVFSDTDG